MLCHGLVRTVYLFNGNNKDGDNLWAYWPQRCGLPQDNKYSKNAFICPCCLFSLLSACRLCSCIVHMCIHYTYKLSNKIKSLCIVQGHIAH